MKNAASPQQSAKGGMGLGRNENKISLSGKGKAADGNSLLQKYDAVALGGDVLVRLLNSRLILAPRSPE
jgi:hypothetical protein